MSIKVALKWFHQKNDRFWHLYKNCQRMWEIWTNRLLPKALHSCPKSNKLPNLVTLIAEWSSLSFYSTPVCYPLGHQFALFRLDYNIYTQNKMRWKKKYLITCSFYLWVNICWRELWNIWMRLVLEKRKYRQPIGAIKKTRKKYR